MISCKNFAILLVTLLFFTSQSPKQPIRCHKISRASKNELNKLDPRLLFLYMVHKLWIGVLYIFCKCFSGIQFSFIKNKTKVYTGIGKFNILSYNRTTSSGTRIFFCEQQSFGILHFYEKITTILQGYVV